MKDSIRPWSPSPCSDFCDLSYHKNFTSGRTISKQEDPKESLMLLLPMSLTLTLINLTRGRGRIQPLWETFLNNSKAAQDIKIKFFKFNLTLMGVILHIMTILINLRSCHGNLLL